MTKKNITKTLDSSSKFQWLYDSPLGSIYIVASAKGLSGLYWSKQSLPLLKSHHLKEVQNQFKDYLNIDFTFLKFFEKTQKNLDQYFQGKNTTFDIPLDLKGTPFQIKVWKELLKIPYGQTLTYKEMAKKINNPKSARAVGNANSKNPICIIVPCHRVIASGGQIGGYVAGTSKKKKLLLIEGAI